MALRRLGYNQFTDDSVVKLDHQLRWRSPGRQVDPVIDNQRNRLVGFCKKIRCQAERDCLCGPACSSSIRSAPLVKLFRRTASPFFTQRGASWLASFRLPGRTPPRRFSPLQTALQPQTLIRTLSQMTKSLAVYRYYWDGRPDARFHLHLINLRMF